MDSTPFFTGGFLSAPVTLLTGAPVAPDPAITTWAHLAAVVTVGLAVNTVKAWVEAATGITHIVVLRAGTDTTDTAAGIQRGNDYNASTNAKAWYRATSP